MRLSPQAQDLAAIIATQGKQWESPEKWARAVWKAVTDSIDMRDTFAVVLSYEDSSGRERGQNFGPYGSEIEAQKAINTLAGAGRKRGIVRLAAPGRLEGIEEGKIWKGFCTCSHVAEDHLVKGSSRAKCARSTCDCTKFTAIK